MKRINNNSIHYNKMNSTTLNMNSIEQSLYACILKQDLINIIKIFEMDCNYELAPSMFDMKRGMYRDSQSMYIDIAGLISELGYGDEHLEMIPYIDDYLMFYFD